MDESRGVRLLGEVGDPVDLAALMSEPILSMVREESVAYGRSSSPDALAEQLKRRTFQLAVHTINLLNRADDSPSLRVVRFQLFKSVTSVGANYRAVCQARSDNDFFAKISIVVEEADEMVYWLEILEATDINIDKQAVRALLQEARPLANFFSKSRATMKQRLKNEKTATKSKRANTRKNNP